MEEQARLARLTPEPWEPAAHPCIAAVFVCFARAVDAVTGEERGWSAAAVLDTGSGGVVAGTVVEGVATAPYSSGLLALREGPLLEMALRSLPLDYDVVLVNATGRDHPRRAGLALHLGAVMGVPTVGVTHRPLLAWGAEPEPVRGAKAPLIVNGEHVGYWLRTVANARPLAVHAAWRTPPDVAADVVMRAVGQARTPEPLRVARRLAREARAAWERLA